MRYYMSLRGDGTGALEGRRVGPRTFGLALPYSPEYLARGADYDQLEAIARAIMPDMDLFGDGSE